MSARLVEALTELVALKDLKDEESRMRQRRECRRLHGSADMRQKVDAMRDAYNLRKPLAWAEARIALAEAEAHPLAGTMAEQFMRAIAGIWAAHPDYGIRQTMDALNAQFPAAQPVQEPVAWMFNRRYGSGVQFPKPASYIDEDGNRIDPVPLFAAPPQPVPLSPLTDEQIDAVTREQWGDQLGVMVQAHRAYARAIERAIGGKP